MSVSPKSPPVNPLRTNSSKLHVLPLVALNLSSPKEPYLQEKLVPGKPSNSPGVKPLLEMSSIWASGYLEVSIVSQLHSSVGMMGSHPSVMTLLENIVTKVPQSSAPVGEGPVILVSDLKL